MKKIKYLLGMLVAMTVVLVLASCGGGNHYVIDSEGRLYCSLEQTITVKATEECSFSENIAAKDLSFASLTKKIDSVTYVSEKEIKVTCSGNVDIDQEVTNSYYYAKLNITGGMNGNNAECLVTVYNSNPSAYCRLTGGSTIKGVKSYTMKLSLPYGNFVEANCTAANITLPDTNGTLTVSLVDDELELKVTGYTPETDDSYPVVKVNANCTSFNKDLYVYIGKAGSYSLV